MKFKLTFNKFICGTIKQAQLLILVDVQKLLVVEVLREVSCNISDTF